MVRAGSALISSFRLSDPKLGTRIFSKISPKYGGLLFAKDRELIGIMANNNYAGLLAQFFASETHQC